MLASLVLRTSSLVRLSATATGLTIVACMSAQTPRVSDVGGASAATAAPERAVRRDIPITNTIRRAYAAGTRDSTGRPGRNYWQTRTDYTISARLDATVSRVVASQRSRMSGPMVA